MPVYMTDTFSHLQEMSFLKSCFPLSESGRIPLLYVSCILEARNLIFHYVFHDIYEQKLIQMRDDYHIHCLFQINAYCFFVFSL